MQWRRRPPLAVQVFARNGHRRGEERRGEKMCGGGTGNADSCLPVCSFVSCVSYKTQLLLLLLLLFDTVRAHRIVEKLKAKGKS